jgi:hypothetical protein
MESFWRRLRYYGLGFGIGLILTFGIFNTRGCSWMPANRVKEAMNARIWVMEEQTQKTFFGQFHFSDSSFHEAIENADIEFTKSRRRGQHKIYQLAIENAKGQTIRLLARMTDESALVDFIPTSKNWQQYVKLKSTAELGKIIFRPQQKNLFYLPENRSLQEAFGNIGIRNDQQLNLALQKAEFSYQKSDLKATPKPLLVFDICMPSSTVGTSKQLRYSITCLWYKDKLKVVALEEAAPHSA